MRGVLSPVVSVQQLKLTEPTRLIDNNDTGTLVLEMTCFYKNHGPSRCPRVVKHVKTQFCNAIMQNVEYLAHYPNSPSCDDETNDFHHR